jgi:hypothetical protein
MLFILFCIRLKTALIISLVQQTFKKVSLKLTKIENILMLHCYIMLAGSQSDGAAPENLDAPWEYISKDSSKISNSIH